MRYVIQPKDPEPRSLGGKAQALADLRRVGVSVPAWFVISAEAFYASLGEEEQRFLDCGADPSIAGQIMQAVEPSSEIRRDLAEALRELCPNGERVAVRSSAREEDGTRHSFAGQLETFLFVHPEDVAD